ncbi:hypothetical protein F4782DRAFT_531451 [Xylaria castorea]|nr:hypothetical protein F4782DRAFT_531451 [Xylaria castorea]
MTENFRKIAEEAERNLNTYEAKTGAHKTSRNDEAGVDTRVENQFPGSQVRYGQDLSTNAGYNEFDPTNKRRHDISSRSAADDTTGAYSGEVMSEGKEAAQSNIESSKFVPHKGQYPGSEYHITQEVPGEMSAEGYEAPASVTEASRESERYNR